MCAPLRNGFYRGARMPRFGKPRGLLPFPEPLYIVAQFPRFQDCKFVTACRISQIGARGFCKNVVK